MKKILFIFILLLLLISCHKLITIEMQVIEKSIIIEYEGWNRYTKYVIEGHSGIYGYMFFYTNHVGYKWIEKNELLLIDIREDGCGWGGSFIFIENMKNNPGVFKIRKLE